MSNFVHETWRLAEEMVEAKMLDRRIEVRSGNVSTDPVKFLELLLKCRDDLYEAGNLRLL